MSEFVAVETLLNGSLLMSVDAWLTGRTAPLKVATPAAGAQVWVRPRGSIDTTADVWENPDGTGGPIAQPLIADADGIVDGFTAQPTLLDIHVTLPDGSSRVLPGPGPGPRISPDQLAGLQLWLDAQALALADGADVDVWPDRSANAKDLTVALARTVVGPPNPGIVSPLYRAAGINGKPAVDFHNPAAAVDGDAPLLAAHSSAGTAPTSGHLTVFAVLQNAARATYAGFESDGPNVIGGSSVVGSGFRWGLADESWTGPNALQGAVKNNYTTDYKELASVPLWLATTPRLVAMTYDGSSLKGYRDGVLTGEDLLSGVSFPDPAGTLLLLGSNGFALEYLGLMGEIIMFDRMLNYAENAGVTNYLRAKWRLP